MSAKTADLHVRVIKKRDDPEDISRVSCGGDPLRFTYCVYRGPREHAIFILETCLASLRALPGEPAISPDEGKRFA